MRLVVGARTFEPGKERMVDVDRYSSEVAAHLFRQYLHVACKHDQLCALTLDDFGKLGFLLWLGFRSDWQIKERNVVGCRKRVAVLMIRNDCHRVHLQSANFVTVKQIVQT